MTSIRSSVYNPARRDIIDPFVFKTSTHVKRERTRENIDETTLFERLLPLPAPSSPLKDI
jgi:hypothetical protein